MENKQAGVWVKAKLVIPPMTHAFGKHWYQPPLDGILISHDQCKMSKAYFESLADYSFSYPTGVYEGKMWKRKVKDKWYLCWYGKSESPDKCSNHQREIVTEWLDEQPIPVNQDEGYVNPEYKDLFEKRIDYSNYEQLAEDVWLFLTDDSRPAKARIKKEALINEVKTMIESAVLFRLKDFEEVQKDHARLVRELDVLINGENGAAKQASLCDIVAQLKSSPSPTPVNEKLGNWKERLEVEVLQEIGDYGLTGGECIMIERWIEENLLIKSNSTPVQEGLKHVNLFLGDLQAKTDRILRDKGASNKDVSDAIDEVVLELSKKYSIIRKSAELVQEGLREDEKE